jgi:hypothetical protein
VTAADLGELAGELFAPEQLSAAAIGPDEQAFAWALGPLRMSSTASVARESPPDAGGRESGSDADEAVQ